MLTQIKVESNGQSYIRLKASLPSGMALAVHVPAADYALSLQEDGFLPDPLAYTLFQSAVDEYDANS